MTLMTIKEAAEAIQLSSYEIRRRVHDGSCPYIRVNKSKILILYEDFIKNLKEEAYFNMKEKNPIQSSQAVDSIGYGKIRRID